MCVYALSVLSRLKRCKKFCSFKDCSDHSLTKSTPHKHKERQEGAWPCRRLVSSYVHNTESLGVRGCQPSLIPRLFLLGNEPVDQATASQDGSSNYQSDALMRRATGALAFSLIPSKKSCSSLLYKSRICLKIICMLIVIQ